MIPGGEPLSDCSSPPPARGLSDHGTVKVNLNLNLKFNFKFCLRGGGH
jgi:hypothetical protein